MSKNNIYFFSEDVKYRIQGKKRIYYLVEEIAKREYRNIGEINIILCSDRYLFEVNVKYLKKDTYTDIITFEYNEGIEIFGDLYISIERIKENAHVFNVFLYDELCRVIVHGVLHLCGYGDNTVKQKKKMRETENKYLALIADNKERISSN